MPLASPSCLQAASSPRLRNSLSRMADLGTAEASGRLSLFPNPPEGEYPSNLSMAQRTTARCAPTPSTGGGPSISSAGRAMLHSVIKAPATQSSQVGLSFTSMNRRGRWSSRSSLRSAVVRAAVCVHRLAQSGRDEGSAGGSARGAPEGAGRCMRHHPSAQARRAAPGDCSRAPRE